MIDIGQFLERAAIMEFDGGMSRFQAETRAAQRQGVQRWEAMKAVSDAKRMGNSRQAPDHGQAAERDGSGLVPGVQRNPQEQARSMPERHVQG